LDFGGFYDQNKSDAHSGNSGSKISSQRRHSEVNAPQSQVLDTSARTQQKQASMAQDRQSLDFGGFYDQNKSEAHSGKSGSKISSQHRHSEVNAPQSQVLDTSIDAQKPKPRLGSEKKITKRRSMADVGGSEIEIKVDLGQATGNFAKKDSKPNGRPVLTKPEDFMKIENGEV
jgi:hypothetical protein